MKKFKDLTASDFPRVDELKFQEWKNAFESANKNSIIILAIVVILNIILIIVWGTFIFPGILLLILMAYLINRKQSRLRKQLGITHKDIRKARRGK